ncbi:MAG: hypothetical protein J6D18_03660 [Erysipelotrichaceae bacterium]|nr:hypothetical protein [Erysipelotrichaceae bacterium]
MSVKKKVVTRLEYECKSEEKEEELFEMVQNIITENLEDFSKITYDIEADHKVTVEVIENK